MSRTIRNLLAILLIGATTTGCVFSLLEDDLDQMSDVFHLFTGEVSTTVADSQALVVVAMHDLDGSDIASFRLLGAPGVFEIRSVAEPTRFFAFADTNRDLMYQAGEAYGWAAGGHAFDPTKESTVNVHVEISDSPEDQPTFPSNIVDEALDLHLNNYVRPAIGDVTPLDSPLFTRERSDKGLWTPFAFVDEGGAGVHFLEPYDPDRIPVLFVHGINGTPLDFETMINEVDTSRFQVWVISYPSGLRLSWTARGMYQFLEVLHIRYEFDELHIIAHSMGGLVSRGSLNLCTQNGTCDYLSSYTTISTPWNGVASAQNGVKWAPTAVPVWHDLDPDSEYVTTLFDTELPAGLPYYLLFGFRHDNVFGAESSDGVIKLTSQLRHEAQSDAGVIRGFDEGHVSILQNPRVINRVFGHFNDAAGE